MPGDPPDAVVALAEARAAARSRRDWAEADRLRADIEADGWTIVDAGVAYRLGPAHAPDIVLRGRTRYGHPSSVPSRLAEAPAGRATVVVIAGDDASAARTTLDSIARHLPAGIQVVAVGDRPPAEVEAVLEGAARAHPTDGDAGLPLELVLTSERLGLAAAIDAGVRRAAAPVVVVITAGVDVHGDVVAPLVRALEDPSVAVAGPWGVATDDLRHLRHAAAGDVDAVAVECVAFRRADYAEHGPIDERLRTLAYVGLWLSLALREANGTPRRRAIALDESLVEGMLASPGGEGGAPRLERAERRDYYRVLARFGPGRDRVVRSATRDAQEDETVAT